MKPGIVAVDFQGDFVYSNNLIPNKVDENEFQAQVTGVKEIFETALSSGMYVLNVETNDCGLCLNELFETMQKREVPKFYKEHPSAFAGEGAYTNSERDLWHSKGNLNDFLSEEGLDTLVIMGVNAPCCVNDTVRDARSLGFRVVTSPDLVLDTNPTKKEYGSSVPFLHKHALVLPDYTQILSYLGGKSN